MGTRKYTQRRRAKQQDATRERIVDATVQLHEKLGPARTTIKAIADLAGVQRLTVYRHFPDDTTLFQACTSRYFAVHPPPDMGAWHALADAGERSRAALAAFYRYYRTTQGMFAVAYRDVAEVAALQAPMAQFEGNLDLVADDLVKAWRRRPPKRGRLRATLRHALQFSTWQSLQVTGDDDDAMADLVSRWLYGIS